MTTQISCFDLSSISSETLTRPVVSLFLSELRRDQTGWIDQADYLALESLLLEPFYMRLVLCYLLPTERDRVVAMMTYGLAGSRQNQRQIVEALAGHPDMRVSISTCTRIQRGIRLYLRDIFSLDRMELDVLSTDCLATLDLEDRTRVALFRLGIRRVSQLTTLSHRELMTKHGMGAYLVNGVNIALVTSGLHFA